MHYKNKIIEKFKNKPKKFFQINYKYKYIFKIKNSKYFKIKQMLNTIYEEFDFESKIKDLKNKKIKIKRVIKSV